MINITLPDGSRREYPGPVTVADIAASIGAGLAKAALAGKVDGKVVDTSYTVDHDAPAPSSPPRTRRPGRDPPFDGAPAGLRGQGAVPRGAGDHRPGDRERLLLRLLVQAPLHARGPGRHREAHDRAGREGRTGHPARAAARRGRGALQEHRRELQGRDHRQHPGRRGRVAVRRRRLRGPVPRPARAQHRQAAALQADEGGRRLLARRPPQRDAAAHLRHGLGHEGGTAAAPHDAGGGREARPPQARPRARPVPHRRRRARRGVLASQGLGGLAAGRAVHAPGLQGHRLPGGQGAADPGQEPVGEDRPLAELPREHVHDGEREARVRAQADELPRGTC
jgi:hypothetical protein